MGELIKAKESITNPELIEAMAALKQQPGRAANEHFIGIMKKSHFLVPVNIPQIQNAQKKENGSLQTNDGSPFNFVLLNNDNKLFFPVFTDLEQFNKWEEAAEHQCIVLDYAGICRFLEKKTEGVEITGIVFNAYDHNVLLAKELFLQLAQVDVLSSGTKLAIGDLKNEPTALTAALRDFFAKHSIVKKAYLRFMTRSDKADPGYLLVLDTGTEASADEINALVNETAVVAKPSLKGVSLAIAPSESGLGKAGIKDAKPFYKA